MSNVDVTKDYSLQQVVDLALIDGVTSYQILYQMVTYPKKVDNPFYGQQKRSGKIDERQVIVKRFPVKETNKSQIKLVEKEARPGQRINGKMYIKGEEIVKFNALQQNV